eukprot:GEMP01025251.1.p1 GENE.GEMP01025251.1~~GEMP01025251.1.p1  ORF type:complete len:435 (+),score=79.42 GEMP01025251.1:130-1434(+)
MQITMGNGKFDQQSGGVVDVKDLDGASPSRCFPWRKKQKNAQPKTEKKANSTKSHTSDHTDESRRDDMMPDVPQEGRIPELRHIKSVRMEGVVSADKDDSSSRVRPGLRPILATYTRPYQRSVLTDETVDAPWSAPCPTSPSSCPASSRTRRPQPRAIDSSEKLRRAAQAFTSRPLASGQLESGVNRAARSRTMGQYRRGESFVKSRQMGDYRVEVSTDARASYGLRAYTKGNSRLQTGGSQSRLGVDPEKSRLSRKAASTVNFGDRDTRDHDRSDAPEGTKSIRLGRSPGSQISRMSRVARMSHCSSKSQNNQSLRSETDEDLEGNVHEILLAVPEGGKSGMRMMAPSMCRVSPPECKEVHVEIPMNALAGLILAVKIPVCQCVPLESPTARRRSVRHSSSRQRRASVASGSPSPQGLNHIITSSNVLDRIVA